MKYENTHIHVFSGLGTSRGPGSNPRTVFFLSSIKLLFSNFFESFCLKKWHSKNWIFNCIFRRRIIYLHEILTREHKELVKRIYRAQKDNPSRGDFLELVTEDLKMINEEFNEDSFLKFSKTQFKNHIKKKVKTEALRQFKLAQEGHSKVKEIH